MTVRNWRSLSEITEFETENFRFDRSFGDWNIVYVIKQIELQNTGRYHVLFINTSTYILPTLDY